MNKQQFKAYWALIRMEAYPSRRTANVTDHLKKLWGAEIPEGFTATMLDTEKFRWLTYREIHSDSKWLQYAEDYQDRQSGPVFLLRDSTDCDLMNVRSVHAFGNKYEAKQYMGRCYDNAEGRELFEYITEEQYKQALEEEPYRRDIAAERMGY